METWEEEKIKVKKELKILELILEDDKNNKHIKQQLRNLKEYEIFVNLPRF